MLYPEEFARRAGDLKKLGVAVEVLDVKAMKKLGMNALLGVGQGSSTRAALVVMRWNGGKRRGAAGRLHRQGRLLRHRRHLDQAGAGMEDMKGDMAGAACVVGLMHALAARKAKVNAVGAIGLVENMPDGKAQRPGDIVTTMSGQTIEIINTDAEGRLVLADVLHYVNKRFKPKFMIDLATLTGAIIVALGQEYAGLFANDDKLAERLIKAGNETGERVWRMPLGPEYDKMIDLEIRRHEEYRRPLGRRDHGRAVPAALRRQDAVGASRHRRHRHGLAADRHQQELGLGLGRAAARPAGGGVLRKGDAASTMTEMLFYHLQRQPLERVLPTLLERSLERGWRVVVQAPSEERVDALDAHLWTYRDDSFLPHGTWREVDTRAAGPAHRPRRQSQRRSRALPDRRRAGAGRCRRLSAHRAHVRRRGSRRRRRGARALERGESQRASTSPIGRRTSRGAGSAWVEPHTFLSVPKRSPRPAHPLGRKSPGRVPRGSCEIVVSRAIS